MIQFTKIDNSSIHNTPLVFRLLGLALFVHPAQVAVLLAEGLVEQPRQQRPPSHRHVVLDLRRRPLVRGQYEDPLVLRPLVSDLFQDL